MPASAAARHDNRPARSADVTEEQIQNWDYRLENVPDRPSGVIEAALVRVHETAPVVDVDDE